jgi:hypothetical protein
MKADAVSLLELFEPKMQYEVPLFQRQYVWERDKHWEPLWEDISRKFIDYLEDRKDSPVHFLGAMVLDQKQTPATHVGKRQIIDGQQRLTTFQIFLAAFRDFCAAHGCEDQAKDCGDLTQNKTRPSDQEQDRFKVWPTQLDRGQFADVLVAGSRAALEAKHPERRRPYARKPEPRPRMVEAYLFFYRQLEGFFMGARGEEVLRTDLLLETRVDECLLALKSALQVVEIDLEDADDPQVIFETLNARGEPLLPADLLRNFIFLRAARRGEPQEALYQQFWSRFDDEFWRHEVKQGRLLRPRSDLFLQHFLTSRLLVDIPIKHLFVEYKHWIDRERPFACVADELACLATQGDAFRRIVAPRPDDVIQPLATFLDAYDVRTCYPLLLALFEAGVGDAEWLAVTRVLESYLLRRAVCDQGTKNYNRVFLGLTKAVRRDGASAAVIARQLLEQGGESTEWPSDEKFAAAWRTNHVYRVLGHAKIVSLLSRLNGTYMTSKMETIAASGQLSVEHILPQCWQEHWPLQGGTKGASDAELWADSPAAAASRARNAALQTIGNLTILTQGLNSAISNAAWHAKRPELLRHSLLPINQQLHDVAIWDEAAIAKRGDDLLQRALKLWPRG